MILPQGTKIALAGGADFNDHRLIWGKLDQIQTKYTDIVLLQGGSPKGADLIAAKWAETRKVTKFAFKPDWTKHAKAAPLKRNDAMLDVLPVGDLVFPGNGIQENLADKANKLGILVPKFEKGAWALSTSLSAPSGRSASLNPSIKSARKRPFGWQ